jgi:hypothetical protein
MELLEEERRKRLRESAWIKNIITSFVVYCSNFEEAPNIALHPTSFPFRFHPTPLRSGGMKAPRKGSG